MQKIEKSNLHKSIDPSQLLTIKKNLEDAFLQDFNVIIEEFDFYQNVSS
jgi:hypothetical protein